MTDLQISSSPSYKFVLQRLEHLSGHQLKYITLVEDAGAHDLSYLGLSRHSLFLCTQDLDSEGESIYFSYIRRIVKDIEDPSLFMITIDQMPSKYICCKMREKLLDEIQVLWKTDHMIRMRQYVPLKVATEKVNFSGKVAPTDASLKAPSAGLRLMSSGGYQTFVPDKFTKSKEEADSRTAKFTMNGDNEFFMWSTLAPRSVEYATRRELSNLRLLCEKLARDVGAQYPPFALLKSAGYDGVEIANHDPAEYIAWTVHLRTGKRDVGVAALRRRFIPPFHDTLQDLVFTYYGPTGESGKMKDSETGTFLDRSVIPLLKYLHPVNMSFEHDKLYLREKLNALMFSDRLYEFLQNKLKMNPAVRVDAMRFYNAVSLRMEQLFSAAGLTSKATYPLIGGHLTGARDVSRNLPSDPFEIVKNVQNLDEFGVKLTPANQENWDRRVSRYFAFFFSAGFRGLHLTLAKLVEIARGRDSPQEASALARRVLDYFVFLRPKNGYYEDAKVGYVPVAKKIDTMGLKNGFTVNEAVFCTLMEEGYFYHVCSEVKTGLYTAFLATVLKLAVSPDVIVAITEEIAIAAKDKLMKQKFVQAGVVQHMVRTLPLDNEHVLLAVAKALVNLTKRDDYAKSLVVSPDIIKHLVRHVNDKSSETVEVLCRLVKNLLSGKSRMMFANSGMISALVHIINPFPVRQAKPNPGVIVEATAVLWGMTRSAEVRDMLVDAGVLPVFATIMEANLGDSVVEKVCGCLLVLESQNDSVKIAVGQQIGLIPVLCGILQNASTPSVIRNLLAALAPLITVDDNLRTLQKQSIDRVLRYASKMNDKHITDLAEKILSQLGRDI